MKNWILGIVLAVIVSMALMFLAILWVAESWFGSGSFWD